MKKYTFFRKNSSKTPRLKGSFKLKSVLYTRIQLNNKI